MNRLLLFIPAALIATQVNAQSVITLTLANAAANPSGVDSIYSINLANMPSTNVATNTVWDFSAVTYNPDIYRSTYGTVTGFPNATHYNDARSELGLDMKYDTKLMFANTSTGIKVFGERVPRQAYSLEFFTGNTIDSLVVLGQDVTYSSVSTVMPFPATHNTQWASNYNGYFNLELTYHSGPYNFNKVPVQRRGNYVANSTIVGWGDIQVQRLDGKKSAKMPVLQTQTTITVTDSFYMNGLPIPQNVLDDLFFGLQQGQQSQVYQRNFYRYHENTPLVSVTYTDGSFSGVEDANVHRQRVAFPDFIKDVEFNDKVKIYPNPVTGKMMNISVDENQNESLDYSIIDLTGKTVVQGNVKLSGGKASITIPASVVAGYYFVRFADASGAATGNTIVIAD